MSAALTQANNLEVHEVPDGYIVYQTERDRVHYLNKTAAIIFELCDGTRETDDIVTRVAKAFELSQSAHDEVRAGVELLIKEGIILLPSK